jgi:hypothetical protein
LDYKNYDDSIEYIRSDLVSNFVNHVLGEVIHDIGVWGLENKIAVTKIDKLKDMIVKLLA